jgi:hypothetical protein
MLGLLSEGRQEMNEDLTKKLPESDSQKLILTAVQNLDTYIRSSVENLVTWVGSIDSRLQRLEQKVEARLYETRPIWEKVVADVAQLQEGQIRLEAGQIRFEEGLNRLEVVVHEIRTSQRDAFRRISLLHETLFTMQADYRDIYDRVRGLETHRDPSNSST